MMPFRPISREAMLAKHMDDYFWYVLDLSVEPPIVITNPFVDKMEELTYIFQEQEDAKTFAFVLNRTPAYQDHKLGIQGDKYRSLLKDEKGEFERFPLTGISHDEAKKMFGHYNEILKTRDLAEDPTLHEDPRLQEE
jgi:hypothetical protein